MTDKEAKAVTVTCKEAAERHPGPDGTKHRDLYIQRLCLKGQALARRYGGSSKVPEEKKRTAIFAKKVGKYWAVPVTELDRIFLP